MKAGIKNKLRALTLLTTFSLNTIVGFACAVDVEMGYNSRHHQEGSTEAVVHIHKDGKRHIHYEKKKTGDNVDLKHDHQRHDHNKHDHNKKEGSKDNCCTEQVDNLAHSDKALPQSLKLVHPIFAVAFLTSFYDVALPGFRFTKDIRQFARSYHPPITDIRIAIRSFQI